MRFMKKFLTLGLAAMAAVALSTGCQKKETTTTETTTQTEAPAVVEETGTRRPRRPNETTDHTETAPATTTPGK
jgi:hypothetical protein